MSALILLALFALGAVTASFVGVVVVRLGTGQSFLRGRSRCDVCDVPLAPLALVPIISVVASRARTRCCGTRLSFISPFSEALLGGLFVLAYLTLGENSALPFMLISLAALLALVLYDLAHQILPPSFLAVFVAASAFTGYLSSSSFVDFTGTLLVAALIAASLAAIHIFSRGRAMGLADTPLSFGLALLTGPFALPGFVFSFWIGSVIGIALLLKRPRGSRMGTEVPFAPFLAAGFLLAYFTQWNPFTLIAAVYGQ